MPRKKKTTISVTPLKVVQDFAKQFPGVWDVCDENIEKFRKRDGNWHEMCKLPFEVAFFSMFKYQTQDEVLKTSSPHLLQAVYSWRIYKEIFTIGKDFAELLMENAFDENVGMPTNILLQLPYPAIYVDFDGWEYGNAKGFFFYIDNQITDFKTKKRSLGAEFFLVNNDGSFEMLPILIEENMNIRKSSEYYFSLNDWSECEYDSKVLESEIQKISELLQIVLYICAANAELTENAEQKKIYKKSPEKSSIKDVHREVQKWDVAVRIGKAVKKHNLENVSEKKEVGGHKGHKGSSKRKRAHVRRAHFHHYWVGTAGEKKLVLKWIPPAFINFNEGDSDNVAAVQRGVF